MADKAENFHRAPYLIGRKQRVAHLCFRALPQSGISILVKMAENVASVQVNVIFCHVLFIESGDNG